ncbi:MULTISPECIES: purine-cytosine permease family protein [Gordonia]|uniref:purine-cytosine permease family protein n=1 Tax=Gordonia sp. 852002-10350_SCH5691597 TaxID=1834085 RepID=UPI0007EB94FD|nr:cytosine permease [Gordonia sp. 852002-10350_SCH5691597]OBA57633.1 allantoin permease [Gordonia sp. 852002-10350_SCH5691597]
MTASSSPTAASDSAGRATAIETRSIDYVPDSERHGKVSQQGPFWFVGNFQPFTLALGFVGPAMGLSLWWTIVAGLSGIAFGTLFMAFHATQGPVLGLPQMIQSRAQFGYRGVLLPLIGTLFTFVGFNVVDTVIIKAGLESIFGWNSVLVAVVISLVAAAVAIFGHDLLHKSFRILFWVSLPLWTILTIGIFAGGVHGSIGPSGAGGFTLVAFLVQFSVAASYNITYAPYVSDYSRYLPRDTKPSSIIASVFIGASASPAWLIPLGAYLATYLGATDALSGIYAGGNQVVSGLGGVLALVAAAVLVATMGLNAYSGMLTVVTAIDSIRPITPTRRLRVVTIVGLTVIWLVLGLALTDATESLNTALLIMLYLLVPWTAVNLTDYFFIRRGHYVIADLFTPHGVYGTWPWRGILAFLIGIAAEIPFMDLPFFVGPVATALGGVDIAFVVGLAVSGLAYVLFSRGQDRSREISLMAAHPEVTDPRDTGEIRAELAVEEKEQH